jgi:hypothetical protein
MVEFDFNSNCYIIASIVSAEAYFDNTCTEKEKEAITAYLQSKKTNYVKI